jgi:hypothetical protein
MIAALATSRLAVTTPKRIFVNLIATSCENFGVITSIEGFRRTDNANRQADGRCLMQNDELRAAVWRERAHSVHAGLVIVR